MNLKTFKNHYMLRPNQTIIIDRSFELDGEEMHLLALTYSEKAYILWVMDCLAEEMTASEMMFEPLKDRNRDALNSRKVPHIRSIESIEIGESVFEFNGSSTESFQFSGSQSLHKLQYFIDQGIELSRWDDMPLSKMQLTAHTNSESVSMVNMNLKNEAIKLKFRSYYKEREVFHKYSLSFCLDESVELKYTNPFEGKEESFFVQGFEIYDLDTYMDSIKNNDQFKNVPKEDLDRMIEMMTNYFEDLNLRNSSLVLMTYEADRGLSFHLTKYLDSEIENSSGNAIGGLGFIFRPDKEKGDHGKRLFMTSFQDVPNDHLETMEFELHSISKKYPEMNMMI